eukprot:763944-Amphidinium_carterae.1
MCFSWSFFAWKDHTGRTGSVQQKQASQETKHNAAPTDYISAQNSLYSRNNNYNSDNSKNDFF